MLEKALRGGKVYYAWLALLLAVIAAGVLAWLYQLRHGLGVTGMTRDVSWGLYIAQFTFMVGVAASAVMVAVPYYFHDHKVFKPVVILGEFLAVSAVIVCMLFIFVDLGKPARVLNVLLHPSPHSVMFWDMCVLAGYLLLNITIGWAMLGAEKKGVSPPRWAHGLSLAAIPWAVSIHTVTAFLYAGLPGRHYWLSAIMAARFLASAFAAGPALLILICLLLRRRAGLRLEDGAVTSLAKVVAYAMAANVFFFLLEVFTATYSGVPAHAESLSYLFFGLEGLHALTPFMWAAAVLAFAGLALLITPRWRRSPGLLPWGLAAVFLACWLDKGVGLVLAGFVPSPFGEVHDYSPTGIEILILLGVYAIGALVLTALYKVVIAVRQEA
jgi:molybdopterin-containing oxidoreductase family membrane subunit